MLNLKVKISKSKLGIDTKGPIIVHQSKKWVIKKTKYQDPLDQLFYNRNLLDKKVRESFLNPNFERDLSDPYLLKNMAQAVDTILSNSKTDSIGIFADYDADGITSAVLLSDCLEKLGFKVIVYIPDRNDGYGLSKKGIDLLNQKVKLIIALDLGVTGAKEIEYAHNLGLKTIVVDHHLVQKEKLPKTIVINPKQNGDKYPFKDFSAGGLTYKLISAIAKKRPKIISHNYLKWQLDLVAISTVADIVPLIGENRVFVYFGLIVLKKTKNIGLKSLYRASSIDETKINPGMIGFQIAPRINAPGRIKNANLAYELLKTKDGNKAQQLAKQIQEINSDRQSELEIITNEAREIIIKKKLAKNKIIMLAKTGWKPGLVGLVAGRLMEEFTRPVIILEKRGTLLKGSARSIEALHLLDAFEHVSKNLLSFGGHKRAGGLSLEYKHLEEVYENLVVYCQDKLSDSDIIPKLTIDAELVKDQLNLSLAQKISQLEPFGFGNPKPVLLLKNQKVINASYVGKEKNHLKIQLEHFNAIMFNANTGLENIINTTIDIIFYPEVNIWNGNKNLSLIVIDYKLS